MNITLKNTKLDMNSTEYIRFSTDIFCGKVKIASAENSGNGSYTKIVRNDTQASLFERVTVYLFNNKIHRIGNKCYPMTLVDFVDTKIEAQFEARYRELIYKNK